MTGSRYISPADLAELVNRAKGIVALTGAGISTSAGIPDFRGPNGLYVTRRYDPDKVFTIGWFRREPRHFFEFARDFATLTGVVRPTFGHRFLARLADRGTLAGIVTQNIDMLHREAGSEKVIELHGSFGSATCQECRRSLADLTYDWWLNAMESSLRAPVALCNSCNGVLKPDIVFFGERVRQYDEAEELVGNCDLLLVLGSSLSVTPASLLPWATNAPTVVVNRGEVTLEAAPHRRLVDADLDGYLREVAERLGMGAS